MLNKREKIINNYFNQRPLVKKELLGVIDKKQFLIKIGITNKETLEIIIKSYG